MNTIEEMLRNGYSANQLVKMVDAASRKIKEEKRDAKKRDELRTNVTKALKDYFCYVTNIEFTEEELNEITKDVMSTFETIEAEMDYFNEISSKIHNAFNETKEESDEEIIKKFIKDFC